MKRLIEQIKEYSPWNEQEEKDKAYILDFIEKNPDCLLRENRVGHLTASAWVVTPKRDKVLMAYHNIYHSWSWLGGHADGDADLLRVAIREVKEESGICDVRAVDEGIYSLEVLTVDGHEKKGKYVSSHLHLNITYLLEADEDQMLQIKCDENSNVGWFGLKEAVSASEEPWFRERIYKKLNEKLLLDCQKKE